MAPGVAERRTHTYVRNGTTSLFAALDMERSSVIATSVTGPLNSSTS
ncbi:putative transposase [Rhizobium sp. 57MFTsu3.2]|jgi:putative transposase|nr:putative transposase [Rhizobium sp. 57MFTsu3.2]